MSGINSLNTNYVGQYQISEINSTQQKAEPSDSDKLEKSVYDRADVQDSVEISSQSQNLTYARTTKGLSDDQISSLKDQMKSTELDMMRKLVESVHNSMKSQLGSIFSKKSSITLSTGAVLTEADFAVPSMPGSVEDAKAALAEGGAWSVDATAKRITDLSAKIANGDVNMLEKMRDAFVKGYNDAERVWGGKLPDISRKTYDAVMNRFDEIKESYMTKEDK